MSGVRASQPVQIIVKEMSAFISYIKDSIEELKNNVSWTPRQELQRLVVIVMLFSVIFSIAIWGADTVLSEVVGFYFQLINGQLWQKLYQKTGML